MGEYDNNKQCAKCRGTNIKLEPLPNGTCSCGAAEHYKKTCLDCGFVSYIHRHILVIEDNGEGVAG